MRAGRGAQSVSGEHGGDAGLAEDELGALRRIVDVDGDVGGSRGEGRQDREVEVRRARGHVDAHARTRRDALAVEPRGGLGYVGVHLGVGEDTLAVIDTSGVGEPTNSRLEHVDERARRRSVRGT